MIDIKDINYLPNMKEISNMINNKLFDELIYYLQNEYKVLYKIEYSKDTWLMGWNIKVRKSSRSLCTIYPKNGYISVLIVIVRKEKEATEKLLPYLSPELQHLYSDTKEGNNQKWLMIDLLEPNDLYNDVLKLIKIRYENRY